MNKFTFALKVEKDLKKVIEDIELESKRQEENEKEDYDEMHADNRSMSSKGSKVGSLNSEKKSWKSSFNDYSDEEDCLDVSYEEDELPAIESNI